MWASNGGGARGVRLHCVTHRKGWWQSNSGILPWSLVYVKLPARSFGKEKVTKVVIIILLIREGEG